MASRKRPPENLDESSSSGHIGHLVVGDEPCTFVQVRDVLYGCASAGKLWLKLIDVAISLEIPTDCITSLEMRIKNGMITYPGALIEILEAWRRVFTAEAKLKNLINALDLNGLADCAEALRIRFNYDVDEVSRLKSKFTLKPLENLAEHSRHKMISKHVIMPEGTTTSNNEESSRETGDNEHFIVGDEPCAYVEVRDALTRCENVNKLWPKLIEVAKSLKIPDDTVIALKLRIPTKMVTYPDALIEILEAWRGKFSSEATLQMFINVLETNGLTDCADALRTHFNEFDDAYVVSTIQNLMSTYKSSTWKNLPDHLKLWMNSKPVKFQGNKKKLEELTAQVATPVDEIILDKLVKGNIPSIVNYNVPERLHYYVHRTVTSRNILKLDVFKAECKDVFVIEGMEKYQLSSLVPKNQSTDVSWNQLVRLTARYILLEHKPDFDKICKIATTPVHWVKYKDEKLELVTSSGSVKTLKKHIHDSQDSFNEEELASRHERMVVIADSPGMGKTCLLANIANQVMQKQPAILVRFIVLKEFVDALAKKKISVESVVKQIAEQSSEYELGKKLVEHALKTQESVLLFDGLDEVLSNQMTTAKEILKAAAKLRSAKVFVATRPHLRDEIENTLHIFAYTTLPFTESHQINFLAEFWTKKGATRNESLRKFTQEFVSQLSSKLSDSERSIAGIPLQCRMLAETYEDQAINCSNVGYHSRECPDSVGMVDFGIYQRHMELRLRTPPELSVKRLHDAMNAPVRILEMHELESMLTQDLEAYDLVSLKCGTMTAGLLNNIDEYLLSGPFVITPLHVAVYRGNYSLVDYLLKIFQNELTKLRYLIHICVHNSDNNNNDTVENKVQIIKLLSKTNQDWINEKLPGETTPLLQTFVHHDLLQCLILLVDNLNACDDYGNTVLHKITERNKFTGESYHRVVNALKEREFQQFNKPNWRLITPLHLAVEHVELMSNTLKLFVSKADDINAVDRYKDSVMFYTVRRGRSATLIREMISKGANCEHINTEGLNVLDISALHGNLEACKYFLEEQRMNVNAKYKWPSDTPLHFAMTKRTENHISIQQVLIQAGADVNAMNGQGRTPWVNTLAKGEGLCMSIFKQMGNYGLKIDETLVSKALKLALLNRNMICDKEFASVIEYLIQKGGRLKLAFIENPWQLWSLQKIKNEIHDATDVSDVFMDIAEKSGILTYQEKENIQSEEEKVKGQRFYEVCQNKNGSFERICMTLLFTNQTRAYTILTNGLYLPIENIHQKYIMSKLIELRECTTVSFSLMGPLLEAGAFSITQIDEIRNTEGNLEKCEKFYTMIASRDCYKILISALEKSRNVHAAAILRNLLIEEHEFIEQIEQFQITEEQCQNDQISIRKLSVRKKSFPQIKFIHEPNWLSEFYFGKDNMVLLSENVYISLDRVQNCNLSGSYFCIGLPPTHIPQDLKLLFAVVTEVKELETVTLGNSTKIMWITNTDRIVCRLKEKGVIQVHQEVLHETLKIREMHSDTKDILKTYFQAQGRTLKIDPDDQILDKISSTELFALIAASESKKHVELFHHVPDLKISYELLFKPKTILNQDILMPKSNTKEITPHNSHSVLLVKLDGRLINSFKTTLKKLLYSDISWDDAYNIHADIVILDGEESIQDQFEELKKKTNRPMNLLIWRRNRLQLIESTGGLDYIRNFINVSVLPLHFRQFYESIGCRRHVLLHLKTIEHAKLEQVVHNLAKELSNHTNNVILISKNLDSDSKLDRVFEGFSNSEIGIEVLRKYAAQCTPTIDLVIAGRSQIHDDLIQELKKTTGVRVWIVVGEGIEVLEDEFKVLGTEIIPFSSESASDKMPGDGVSHSISKKHKAENVYNESQHTICDKSTEIHEVMETEVVKELQTIEEKTEDNLLKPEEVRFSNKTYEVGSIQNILEKYQNESSVFNTDKEPLVVGDEPCTFVEVGDVLCRCASVGKLWPKLIDVGRSLKIPTDCIISLKKRIINYTIIYPDALLEILEAWRGKFSAEAKLKNLINVLERNSLADCADALRIHFNEFDDAYVISNLQNLKSTAKSRTWENLPEHLKHWMNRKPVKFQGNENKLQELTALIATPVDEKILDELVERKVPCIVKDTVPAQLEYYIHRNVRSRNILKIGVLKENCKDVFVIEGMDIHQINLLVPGGQSTDVSGNQLVNLTVRFILLEYKNDFEKISQFATTAVHWIKFINGRFEHVKSSGSIKTLQNHIDGDQYSFNEKELASRHERVVVIADSPGMGKTCLLAKIAHQIMRENPTILVRFVVLKEFVDKLNNKKINVDSIVKVIAEQSSEYEFGRKFVEHALKTQECVLLFDGLDEVLLNQLSTAKKILQKVATLSSAKVYVATRPHLRDEIENELHVFAYNMNPFEESNQVNFLTRFWRMRGATSNDSLTKFTQNCVSQLSSKMTDSERSIAGIPLQCRMIAETYEDQAIRCSNVGYHSYEGSDSANMVDSTFGLYERHMELRFEKIRKQESLLTRLRSFLTRSDQHEVIKNVHMYFALELLFPDHAEKFKTLNSSSIELHELCGLGIIEATHSNDIRFVHRTFAEFLVAMLAHECNITSSNRDILLSSILKLQRKYLEIKTPFIFLGNTKYESFEFNFPMVCYFLNGFTKSKITNEITIDYHDEAIPYYIASAFHNYENIPYIVTRSFTNINPIETDELFKRNLFLNTAMHSELELMRMFCSVIDVTQINFMYIEDSYKADAFRITPLHVAVQRGHYRLVEYLLKKLEGKVSILRFLMHFCVHESAFQSNLTIYDKIQIIKLLVRINKEWIDEKLIDQTTSLLQKHVHADLLELLIHEGANLNIYDYFGNTVLHVLTKNNEFTSESYDTVVNALSQRGFQHFNKPNSKLITPLQYAMENVELLSITLELFISKGADLNAVDEEGDSVLLYSIRGIRRLNLIHYLISHGANFDHRNAKGLNVLHMCSQHGHLDALTYFISLNIDVNTEDKYGNTPLHFAVMKLGEIQERIQRFLITSGASVNALNKAEETPILKAVEYGNGLSLSIIKLMEEYGLVITENEASNILKKLICNRNITYEELERDNHFSRVLEYLIFKGGVVNPRLSANPWRLEHLRKNIDAIIQATELNSELINKAKQFELLTEHEMQKVKAEPKSTQELKESRRKLECKRFYARMFKKKGSYERLCMALVSCKQVHVFVMLRQYLYAAEFGSIVFITPPTDVMRFINSQRDYVMVICSHNIDLSIMRIRNSIDSQVKVIEEHDLKFENSNVKLAVVKCRLLEDELMKKFTREETECKVIWICSQVSKDLEKSYVTDIFTWADISNSIIKRKRFIVGDHEYNANELLRTPTSLQMLFEKDVFRGDEIRIIAFKVGHKAKDETNYLSTDIFHYHLYDKIVFLGISTEKLHGYSKFGHKIGTFNEIVDKLDYVIIHQVEQFENVCKSTTQNVHLIEYSFGVFKVIKTWGSNQHIREFITKINLCEDFPACNCDAETQDLMVEFTFQNRKHVSFNCFVNVEDILPILQKHLELDISIQLFQLTSLLKIISQQPSSSLMTMKHPIGELSSKSHTDQIIYVINELLKRLQPEDREQSILKHVAVNTLFPKFVKSTQLIGLEKFVQAGLVRAESSEFVHEFAAWYFIALLMVGNDTPEYIDLRMLRKEGLLEALGSKKVHVTFRWWDFFKYRSKEMESFEWTHNRVFDFIESLLICSNKDSLKNHLEEIATPELMVKCIHACVVGSHANLLEMMINVGKHGKLFESEELVVIAVKYANENVINIVVEQYMDETEKNITNIRFELKHDDEVHIMSVLHVAALRGDHGIVRYLLYEVGFMETLNHQDMKNILHHCVIDTHAETNVNERIKIIELIIKTNPSLLMEKDKHECTPLLCPNIHVDLMLRLIQLGSNTSARDKKLRNLLHLSATYMSPAEYDKLVRCVQEEGNSKIFNVTDKARLSPLHLAVRNMEVKDSSLDLFSDFNSRATPRSNVLMSAVTAYRSSRLLDSLISRGAIVGNRGGKLNRTLLHMAIECANLTATKYLISKQNADVNAKDEEANTPLHLALKLDPFVIHELVQILLEHGANVNVHLYTETPLSIALTRKENDEIQTRTVNLLKKYGAR